MHCYVIKPTCQGFPTTRKKHRHFQGSRNKFREIFSDKNVSKTRQMLTHLFPQKSPPKKFKYSKIPNFFFVFLSQKKLIPTKLVSDIFYLWIIFVKLVPTILKNKAERCTDYSFMYIPLHPQSKKQKVNPHFFPV